MSDGLRVRGLTVTLSGSTVVHSVSLDLTPGRVAGLVGPNGAGKTTLLEALSGFVAPASGSIHLDGAAVGHLAPHRRARLGLGRTFQALELFEDLSVGDNLATPVAAGGARGRGEDRQHRFDLVGDPDLAALVGRRPAELSHGERSRVALARALVAGPRVLLLDEPAAGLDSGERAALAARLRDLAATGMAVLIVEHDLDLVFDACDDIHVLDGGRVVATGDSGEAAVLESVAALGLWSPTPPGGEAGGGGVRGGSAGHVRGRGAGTDRGAAVLDVADLAVAYGLVPAVLDARLDVFAGEVVALVGPNGAGKTTTLLAIAGALRPTRGAVRIRGTDLAGAPAHAVARRGVALVTQDRPVFASLTVEENLALAARGRRGPRRLVGAAVGLVPELAVLLHRRASTLSGGERRLLALARAVASEPALLMIDEMSLGLAASAAARVRTMLGEIAGAGTAVLVVDQQARVADGFAQRTYVMERGRVLGG